MGKTAASALAIPYSQKKTQHTGARTISCQIALAAICVLTVAAIGCVPAARGPGVPPATAPDGYREAWAGAAEWLLETGIQSPHGKVWAADPRDPQTVSNGLYSGYPGVVLFLLEAARVSGDSRYLDAGRAGADHLLEQIESETDCGLYTGLAGMAFTLADAARLTRDERYRDGARRATERILSLARRRGAGIEWEIDTGAQPPESSNDIVSGTAGTGLFLLWAARQLGMPAARDAAVLAGRRLVEVSVPTEPDGEGRKWLLTAGFDRVYPNFSHGTAGVAYFLATLHEEAHEAAFLDSALCGARYLETIATWRGDSCLIFRHEPDARDLYYYSWCHGPAGTARLFYRLFLVTRDKRWMDFAESLARGVLASGIPETPQPGFWNVSQCCGSAGLGEFFLALHKVTGKEEHLVFARRMSDHLVQHATRNGKAFEWVQAENRTEPGNAIAQTGYMQGAAGIGLWLLRFDAFEQGKSAGLTLPDSPF